MLNPWHSACKGLFTPSSISMSDAHLAIASSSNIALAILFLNVTSKNQSQPIVISTPSSPLPILFSSFIPSHTNMHWIYVDEQYRVHNTMTSKRHTKEDDVVPPSQPILPPNVIALYCVTNNVCFHNVKGMTRYSPLLMMDWHTQQDMTGFMDVQQYIHTTIHHPTTPTSDFDRPACYCHLPCEVHLSPTKTQIYFTCPKPITSLSKCTYWEEYIPFRLLREAYIERMSDVKSWIHHLPRSLGSHLEICLFCSQRHKSAFWYSGKHYDICDDCFHLHYFQLRAKYHPTPYRKTYHRLT
jgi:hypothetical protein